jgi:DNA replication and repair protein RecF
MYLTRLVLANFRNYTRLALEMTPGPILLCGDNAQGKTNLLEAIFFLATTRSAFARAERQIINWQSLEQDTLPFARVEAHVRRGQTTLRLDTTLLPDESGTIHKEMRLNGVRKRALDIVGQLNVVLFLPEDIELIVGAPSARRRYLDITLCQVDASYCRALSQYNQVLAQRNALLKQLAERSSGAGGRQDQLLYWDDQLAEYGALLIVSRRETIYQLDRLARQRYHMLGGQHETLRLYYAPSFDPEHRPLLDYQRPLSLEEVMNASAGPEASQVAHAFVQYLREVRREEIGRGMTVVGPHRDDLHFLIDGVDMTLYGSRGQQRTTALALKLAEVDLMTQIVGEAPLLLLDDVMSELDAGRRARVMAVVDDVQQSILTTTDWNDYHDSFRARARLWQVTAGQIALLSETPGVKREA